jgi:hypothetical protein
MATAAVAKKITIEPRKCRHVGLIGFTFKDGKIIRLCKQCTQFDRERREVLGTPTKPIWRTR